MVQKFELMQVFLILPFFFLLYLKNEKKKENYFFHTKNLKY